MATGLFAPDHAFNDMETVIRQSRCRNVPFTSAEKEKLFRLISKYGEVLENKEKAVAPRERSRAWLRITAEFNTHPCECRRETKQLRKMWDNVKFRLRKNKKFDDSDIVLRALRALFGRPSELLSTRPSNVFTAVCKTETDGVLHSSATERVHDDCLEEGEDVMEAHAVLTVVTSPAALTTTSSDNEPRIDDTSYQDKQRKPRRCCSSDHATPRYPSRSATTGSSTGGISRQLENRNNWWQRWDLGSTGDWKPAARLGSYFERRSESLVVVVPLTTLRHATPRYPSRSVTTGSSTDGISQQLGNRNSTDTHRKALDPPYQGSYPVLSRGDKTFTVDIKGHPEVVSLDCLKPAFLGCLHPAEPQPDTDLQPVAPPQRTQCRLRWSPRLTATRTFSGRG